MGSERAQVFKAVERLLDRRRVRFVKKASGAKRGLSKEEGEAEPFSITFHQRLGAHDVTVVKVNRPDEFADWVQEKAKALTGGQAALPDSIRKLITKYLNEYNCPYFVFDVIEVGPDPQSIEPIIYEFKSPVVFYPLEISSTFHGHTSIDLVVFAEDIIDQDPFWTLDFQLSTAAWVDANDMQEVLPRLRELLGETACIQAFRYSGDIQRLKGNISVGLRREKLAYTSERYKKDVFAAFCSGVSAGIYGGLFIAFLSLLLMYFAARRQKPRWGLRLMAGFLLGMPLGCVLIFGVNYLLDVLDLLSVFFPWTEYYSLEPVKLISCSMGMGFIIFCFQFGLRRRWFLWWLVYAVLAFPATVITAPGMIEGLYDLFAGVESLGRVWDLMRYNVIVYLIVFIVLFLIARLLVWITETRKRRLSSLSR